jgi:prevent-host-death family protein
MKTVSIADFKANFSDYAEKVQKGLELIVTSGRNKKKIFKVMPIEEEKPFKRKLGLLKGKATVVFHDDWKMTTEEFLGS